MRYLTLKNECQYGKVFNHNKLYNNFNRAISSSANDIGSIGGIDSAVVSDSAQL